MKKTHVYPILFTLFDGQKAEKIQEEFMLRFNTQQKRDIYETRAAKSKLDTKITFFALGYETPVNHTPVFLLAIHYLGNEPLPDEELLKIVARYKNFLEKHFSGMTQVPLPMDIVGDLLDSFQGPIGSRYDKELSAYH